MIAKNRTMQTVLGKAHLDENGVISFQLQTGDEARLVYSIAQQAMLGRRFIERIKGGICFPYAEFIDINLLPSPGGDAIATAASDWLLHNSYETKDGGIVWLHDFDFTYTNGDLPISAPWLSGIGQANALLACLHWWRHTHDLKWRELAHRAVIPFTQPLNTQTGVDFETPEGGSWFEEYPTTTPAHILNCHLLSLVALDCAASTLDLPAAKAAFERGWRALNFWITRYDRGDWSRYDQCDRLFLFIRLVPSQKGTSAIKSVELRSSKGLRIVRFDTTQVEPHDRPISRIAGIDWGPVKNFKGQAGRLLTNRQSVYTQSIPKGGTNQNTYLIFEEDVSPEFWIIEGVRLKIETYLSGGAELSLEFRDPRQADLSFRSDEHIIPFREEGWQTFDIAIPVRLIGQPLPRHYHRFQTELLGALLATHCDETMEKIFQRWHRSDLFDILPYPTTATPVPKTIYLFVNNQCGLHCRMCDIGIKNRKAALSHHMAEKGLELNPDILIRTLKELGDNAQNMILQLTGTEPLLYSRFPELLKAAKSIGLHTGITTNGLLLAKEAERLADAGVDQILLSIDGPPQIHDKIRGCPGLFNRIMSGLDALSAACRKTGNRKPHIDISFTISKDNHLHILEFLAAVKSIHPNSVVFNHLNFVTPEIAKRHNQLFPEYPIGPSSISVWKESLGMDFWELFWQLEEARKTDWTEVRVIPYCPTPMRLQWYYTKPELPMSRPHCAAPWACTQILCDGTVAVLGRCFDVTMGDLKTETLKEIWAGESYTNFRSFVVQHSNLTPCMRCCGSL